MILFGTLTILGLFLVAIYFISEPFYKLIIIIFFRNVGLIAYDIYKFICVRTFCDIINKLKPQYQFLSRKFSLVTLGEVYIIHIPSFFKCDFFYLIKFLQSYSIENAQIKLPVPKFITAFNKEEHSIKLARFRKSFQIPYNQVQSLKGECIVYCLQFSEVKNRYGDVPYLIYKMNRVTPDFTRHFKEHAKLKLFLLFISPIIFYVLIRSLL